LRHQIYLLELAYGRQVVGGDEMAVSIQENLARLKKVYALGPRKLHGYEAGRTVDLTK